MNISPIVGAGPTYFQHGLSQVRGLGEGFLHRPGGVPGRPPDEGGEGEGLAPRQIVGLELLHGLPGEAEASHCQVKVCSKMPVASYKLISLSSIFHSLGPRVGVRARHPGHHGPATHLDGGVAVPALLGVDLGEAEEL